jgi:hypothetical protein
VPSVVQAACRIEGMVGHFTSHELRGDQRCAAHGSRRGMHPFEDRVVGSPQAEGKAVGLVKVSGVDAFDRCYEFGIVNRLDLGIGGDPGRHLLDHRQIDQAERSDVLVREQDALGTQGMGRAEIVGAGDVVDYYESNRITHPSARAAACPRSRSRRSSIP